MATGVSDFAQFAIYAEANAVGVSVRLEVQVRRRALMASTSICKHERQVHLPPVDMSWAWLLPAPSSVMSNSKSVDASALSCSSAVAV